MKEITIFSPATVANVSCGFDVFGFCLSHKGDQMVIRKTKEKGIKITKIEGFELPLKTEHNVVGVAALAIYNHAKPDFGFEIEIYKNIKPGSGIGSSSASASGVVFAINELLQKPYTKEELISFAVKGEALASGSEHADNLAPGIYGGFTLVKSVNPVNILSIPVPKNLYATIIHPQIEIKTSEARALLPSTIPLKDAITQWANTASLIHGLHTQDYHVISDALKDVVVEPYRSQLIPYFNELQTAVLKSGALGCGISGSGPSIFALSEGEDNAKKVELCMNDIYSKTAINYSTFVSKINTEGITILNKN